MTLPLYCVRYNKFSLKNETFVIDKPFVAGTWFGDIQVAHVQ